MSLEARNVTQSFAGHVVLDDLSFSVESGETVAITGPSGSGKTTLLSILGLLSRPDVGQVLVDGREVSHGGRRRDRLRSGRIAWIFQTVNVLGHRSALDNVALGLLTQGVSRFDAETAAIGALTAVGLEDKVRRPVRELSGGEVQRVCGARAIAGDPGYLLADEPTGQLDRATTDLVIDSLLAARSADTAVVIATHDPLVAGRCERVMVLDEGGIRQR